MYSILFTRPWQTYQFSFFMPFISITPLNYRQSTENSIKWWAASSKENFGTSWKLFTWNVKKLAFLRIKNAKFMTFLTLSGNSGNSVDRHDGMFTKKILQLLHQTQKCLVTISCFSMDEPVDDIFEFSVKF